MPGYVVSVFTNRSGDIGQTLQVEHLSIRPRIPRDLI